MNLFLLFLANLKAAYSSLSVRWIASIPAVYLVNFGHIKIVVKTLVFIDKYEFCSSFESVGAFVLVLSCCGINCLANPFD
jgi:hypothetical protein